MLIRFWCDSEIIFSLGLHTNLVTVLYFSIINVLFRAGGDASFAPQANLVNIACCIMCNFKIFKITFLTNFSSLYKMYVCSQKN